jgi:hypothetical protein
MSRSSSTSTPAALSVGGLAGARRQPSSLMHWSRRYTREGRPTASFIIRIADRNMSAFATLNGSRRQGSTPPSAVSAIAMIVNVVSQPDGLTHATIDQVSLR